MLAMLEGLKGVKLELSNGRGLIVSREYHIPIEKIDLI